MIRFVHNLVIAVIGISGALLLVSSLSLGGLTARVVMSGSMEPTIPTGSVILISTVSAYGIGDVITFQTDARASIPTSHRIVGERVNGTFLTQGDANKTADFTSVSPSDVVGKVLFHVPYLGYVLDFAKRPLGFFLLVGIPVLYIIFEETREIIKAVREHCVILNERKTDAA